MKTEEAVAVTLVPNRADPASPTFSFLTTAYRTEDTLGRTIAAVRRQSWADWELVVVDNGMSDAVVAVAEPHLHDSRITLIRQENRGAGGGVQAAAAIATGRYLVVLNSDDAVTPEFCARMSEVFEEHPDVAAVTCDAYQFSDPGMRMHTRAYLGTAGLRTDLGSGRRLSLADVIDGPCPFYCAAIRSDVWHALGGMGGGECIAPSMLDLDFWLRLLAAGHDVLMIPDRLGLFRIEHGSESRPDVPERAEVVEQQRERALVRAAARTGAPEDQAALDRVLRRLRYFQAIRRARVAYLDGDLRSSRVFLSQAFGQRRTLRVGAIMTALTLAPTLVVRLHPMKRHVQTRLHLLRARS